MNKLQHIAFIMDGNGRWGKKKKKSRNYGHLKGLETKSRQTRMVPLTPSLYNRLISYYLDTAVTDEEFLEFNKDNYSDPTQMKSSRRINPIHKHKRIFSMNDIKTSFNNRN